MKKQYRYCIHCGCVFGRSGFYSHKETFILEPDDAKTLTTDFFINNEKHTSFIREEFAWRFKTGRMRGVGGPNEPNAPLCVTPLHLPTPTQERRPFPVQTPNVVDQIPPIPMVDVPQQPPDDNYGYVEDSYPQLFDCLSVDGFDKSQFDQFVRNNFRLFVERMGTDPLKIQKEKAKIISVLAHSLYMMCTLTKNQMKQITAFWKTMITFITPEAEETAKKIHVSYSSCLREAKRSDETQARHMEMFRNCMFFSLALDTAQFGLDHFLSYVARFGFEDRIQQVLFFEKVSETTGNGLARFIFGQLNEKRWDFSKLVSITTDGVKNMVGPKVEWPTKL